MIDIRHYVDPDEIRQAIASRGGGDLHKLLMLPIGDYLAALRANGQLVPAADLGARDVRFLSSWNAYVANTAERWQEKDAVSTIVDYVARTCMLAPLLAKVGATEVDPWEVACRFIDTGSTASDRHDFGAIKATDHTTGERGQIRLSAWQPSFWILKPSDGTAGREALDGERHMQAEPLPRIQPTSAEFTARSDVLLVTDTIRLGRFSDSIDFGKREYGPALSLNSTIGCQARITAHAETHNFGYCQTTNTTVAVLTNDATGAILISQAWDEATELDVAVPGWTNRGTVSCDIWRITVIDRDTAAALVDSVDAAAGGQLLGDYLASGDVYAQNIISIPVAARSRWNITAGENFSEDLDRAAHGIPESCDVHIWALIEPV